MKRIAMTLLCLGAFGCSGSAQNQTERDIQNVVRESLIDPGSAQFGEIVMSTRQRYACVGVNARNRLGGYTGMKQVMVARLTDGEPTWASLGDASEVAHRDVSQRVCLDWINRMEAETPDTPTGNTSR